MLKSGLFGCPNGWEAVVHMQTEALPVRFLHYRSSALRVKHYALGGNGLQTTIAPELGMSLTHHTNASMNRLQQLEELSFIEEPS
jgi:hypothetical protein